MFVYESMLEGFDVVKQDYDGLRLLAAREPLYRRYAAFTVQNDTAPAQTADAVCRWFAEGQQEGNP